MIRGILFRRPWRCFAAGEQHAFKRWTVLAGDQGTGKTSILRAIAVLTGGGPPMPGVDGAAVKAAVELDAHPERIVVVWYDSEHHNPRVQGPRDDHFVADLKVRWVSHGQMQLPALLNLLREARARRARIDDAAQLVLLDEPEAGLSVRSQTRVAEATAETVATEVQVICATHSAVIVDACRAGGGAVVDLDAISDPSAR